MKIRKRIVLLFVALLALSACGDKAPKLATVDGKTITQAQFDAYAKFKRLPVQDDNKRNALVDQYLEREALASVIEKSDVLDKTLAQAELNEFRKEMLISRYFEQYLRDQVSDQAVQNYYASHAGDYEEKKVHVAHVLIRTKKNMSETERKVRLTTAQEVYSKISAGEDFAKVAADYSEDTVSGKKGGDLGWMKEGAIAPVFSKTIFGMSPGEVSEPFETPFGFHVVKQLEAPTVVKRPFEAVKGDIRYQLRSQAKDAELKRLLSKTVVKRHGK